MAKTGPEELGVDCDLEEKMDQFIDRQRCRRAVATIATSCLDACGPLLASKDPQPCLLALDTVEVPASSLIKQDVMLTL
jgi:hypothetical protein